MFCLPCTLSFKNKFTWASWRAIKNEKHFLDTVKTWSDDLFCSPCTCYAKMVCEYDSNTKFKVIADEFHSSECGEDFHASQHQNLEFAFGACIVCQYSTVNNPPYIPEKSHSCNEWPHLPHWSSIFVIYTRTLPLWLPTLVIAALALVSTILETRLEDAPRQQQWQKIVTRHATSHIQGRHSV